jgi:hypothetical protein
VNFRILLPFLGAMTLGAGLAGPVAADDGHSWHDRDIHHFHEHDIDHWRAGTWYHGRHGSREGWWWVVSGVWYYYPTPVYPYPDPYLPPVAVAPPAVPAPPPAVMPPPPPAGPPQAYYFCDRPRGYYPYVAACSRPWRMVPTG